MEARQRDFVGYGNTPPNPHWPQESLIAINIVLNYEEGGEKDFETDNESETYLAEIPGMTAVPGERNCFSESTFEFGSGEGCWRLLDICREYRIPVSVFATGLALSKNPKMQEELKDKRYDILGHGWRWIDYRKVPKEIECSDIQKTIEIIKQTTGKTPMGWYTGRHSSNTRGLVFEAGLTYSSDDYSGSLPFYTKVEEKPFLIIPYTMDMNDAKYCMQNGWKDGEDFLSYLKNSFDCLYREGSNGSPKMMTVALHGRISGRPGRAEILRKFLEYTVAKPGVWFCNRDQIAKHWLEHFPHPSIKKKVNEEDNNNSLSQAKEALLFKEPVTENNSGLDTPKPNFVF